MRNLNILTGLLIAFTRIISADLSGDVIESAPVDLRLYERRLISQNGEDGGLR